MASRDRSARSIVLRPGESDPHIWLDPVRFAQAWLQRSAAPVGSCRPAAAARGERSRALDDEYRRAASRTVSSHDDRHDATPRSAISHDATASRSSSLAGRAPEAEPSPTELEALVDDGQGVRCDDGVRGDPRRRQDSPQTVAREAGVDAAVLDPHRGAELGASRRRRRLPLGHARQPRRPSRGARVPLAVELAGSLVRLPPGAECARGRRPPARRGRVRRGRRPERRGEDDPDTHPARAGEAGSRHGAAVR